MARTYISTATATFRKAFTQVKEAGDRILQLGPGTFTLSGRSMLIQHFLLVCGSGSYVMSGKDVAITAPLVCGPGEYDVTGKNVLFTISQLCGPGDFTLSGKDATLTLTEA